MAEDRSWIAPKSVKKADRGGVYVENNHGNIIVVDQLTAKIVLEGNVSQPAEKFVRRPLIESASHLIIKSDGVEVASVTQDEAVNFLPVQSGDVLVENKSDIYITVATTIFEGKGKWRFNDGRMTFSAEIEDQVFLDRVAKGLETFRKGDTLFARVRSTQKKIRGKLKADFAVEEVLSHLPGSTRDQLGLL